MTTGDRGVFKMLYKGGKTTIEKFQGGGKATLPYSLHVSQGGGGEGLARVGGGANAPSPKCIPEGDTN